MEKACEHCGAEFKPSRSTTRFCGKACREKQYYLDNKAKWTERWLRQKAEDPSRNAAKCRERYYAQREERLARNRVRAEENREQILEYRRAYYSANREYLNEQRRLKYQESPELRERLRAYRIENWQNILERRRANSRASGPVSATLHIAHTMKELSKEKPDDQP